MFYVCSFSQSSPLELAHFLAFRPDVICGNAEDWWQVRFD